RRLVCILFINVCLEMFMIIACLPLEFTQEQYDTEDRKLVVALSVTLGLFAVELAGFFSGVSMFNSSQEPLWPCCFFLFEQWECA
uniref:Transmembrane protein 107 n=1 Tax=Oryzias melastigma TaxID=30732 RepID=A0A3B3BLN9_ORYME